MHLLVAAAEAAGPQHRRHLPRAAAAGGDTNLTTLALSTGALDQQFQPTLTSYTATVGYLDNAVRLGCSPRIPPRSFALTAHYCAVQSSQRIALSEGQNAIDVAVQNGSVQKNYSIALTRETRASFDQSAYLKSSNTGIEDSSERLSRCPETRWSSARRWRPRASSESGAAYVSCVTRRWLESAGVSQGAHADPIDNFGYPWRYRRSDRGRNAIRGQRAVGVNGDPADDSLPDSGAVYIFARDSSGQWTQEAYIKPSNTVASGEFGKSVALEETLGSGRAEDPDAGRLRICLHARCGRYLESAGHHRGVGSSS